MTLSDYIKQTDIMQNFKKWTEMKWKQFWCQHDFKVSAPSIGLPMPIMYQCPKCEKWKS